MSEYNDNDLLLNDGRSTTSKACCCPKLVSKHKWIPCCCTVFLGLILVILSAQVLIVPNLLTNILNQGIKDSLIFKYPKPNDSSYKTFLSNEGKDGVPIWMETRFFNVTNPDEVLLGEYPILVQSPPIVYNEWEVKTDVNFSDNGEWVEYNSKTYYTLNTDRSQISPNDYFVVFSPFVPAVYHAHEVGGIMTDLELDIVFKYLNEHPELLFLKGTAEEILLESIRIPIKIPFTNDTFWWESAGGLMGSNTSSPSIETTNTGYKDKSRLGEVKQWQGSEWVSCWNPALELAPGHDDYFGLDTIKKGGSILAWVDSLFVNLVLEYDSTTNYNGIELYKYYVQIEPQFLNASEYPPNGIYYAYGPSGVLNLTSCFNHVPLFVSLPYFLGGPDYEANLTLMGLHNITWDQQPFISVEPITGAIFNANKSLMINTQIKPVPQSWLNGILDDTSNANTNTDTESVMMEVKLSNNDNINIGKKGNSTNTTLAPTPTPTTATPTTATPTTATPTTATPTTATPTTTTPTNVPTPNPTELKPSLANIPYLMVPIIESSECEGLTKSQSNSFVSEIYGTQHLIEAIEIIGYVSTGLLVLYTWCVCYTIGKRRAMIRN